MNIYIITHETSPIKAYFNKDKAYKEYRTLRDGKGPVGNYVLIILKIEDAILTGV